MTTVTLQIAERNRGCYRKLRTELESLTESGICLNKKLVVSGASVMQRLTVEMLCNQLDNTWKYFTATFKMQVRHQTFNERLSKRIKMGANAIPEYGPLCFEQ